MKPKHTMSRSYVSSTCVFESKRFYETDDDRDSGTESDDEGAEIEELQKYMESIIHLDSHHQSDLRQRSRRPQPNSHHPQQQVTTPAAHEDQEEQEQERPPHHHHHHRQHQHHRPRRRPPPRRSPPAEAEGDSALPSDSEAQHEAHSSEEELEGINSGPPPPCVEKRKWGAGDPPVQFRTSPPAHARRPGGLLLRQADLPPHELCSASPRKRHRRTPTAVQQRPCLDFEKMQQINRVRLL